MLYLSFAEPDVTKQGSSMPTPQPAPAPGSVAPGSSAPGGPPASAGGKSPTPAPGTAVPGQPTDEMEQASVGDEVNTTLTLLLPWVISVLLHFGIILLAFFLAYSVQAPKEDDENVIPQAKLLTDNPSELLVYSEQLDVTATTEIPRDIQTQEVAKGDPLSAVTTETADSLALIGVSGSKALPAGSKIGKDKTGVGMFGLGGNAMTVVYCVDASGSMVDSFNFVINELKDSLRKLSPQQRFNVVFFQAGSALEVPIPNRGMKKGTIQNIKLVSDWISTESRNVVPHGSTDPIKAVTLALSFKPDLVYILSDNITGRGRYQIDQKDLLKLIEDTKKQQHSTTRINTIQFLYPDPLGTLKLVSEKNGGRYRFVDESVVGGR